MATVPPAAITAAPFPAAQWPANEYLFKKYHNYTVQLRQADLQRLYAAKCIEVNGLPPCDLTNPIHPLFQAGRFHGFSAAQYAVLRPAVLLASRFVTEDNYMGFWTRMYNGQSGIIGPGTAGPETIYIPPVAGQTPPVLLANTRQALVNLSTRLMFRCWDPAMDAARPFVEGEAFADADDWNCKRHQALHKGTLCGTCTYCVTGSEFRCPICNETTYRMKKCTKAVLMGILTNRGIAYNPRATKDQLVQLAENDDQTRYPTVPNFQTTNAQISDLRVGLRHEVLEYTNAVISGARWTPSEEARFMFSLATTLVHETVHQFWDFRSRRCFRCDLWNEPWWSPQDELRDLRVNPKPELGESWEAWAFGSLRAWPGKIHERPGQAMPSVSQRCQWLCVGETVNGGRGHPDGVLRYDYVLPVEYYNSWFREATWMRIRNLGRVPGRPDFAGAVIMRQIAERLTTHGSDVYDLWKSRISRYTYAQLVAAGGFNNGPVLFLHGNRGLAANKAARAGRLRRAKERRSVARKREDARRKVIRILG